MKMSYEEFLKDREEMPVYDESIFYPATERRKLGINDEDMECIVEFFRWHINQRNRRMDRQRIITILKLRAERLMNQKSPNLLANSKHSKIFRSSSSPLETRTLGDLKILSALC